MLDVSSVPEIAKEDEVEEVEDDEVIKIHNPPRDDNEQDELEEDYPHPTEPPLASPYGLPASVNQYSQGNTSVFFPELPSLDMGSFTGEAEPSQDLAPSRLLGPPVRTGSRSRQGSVAPTTARMTRARSRQLSAAPASPGSPPRTRARSRSRARSQVPNERGVSAEPVSVVATRKGMKGKTHLHETPQTASSSRTRAGSRRDHAEPPREVTPIKEEEETEEAVATDEVPLPEEGVDENGAPFFVLRDRPIVDEFPNGLGEDPFGYIKQKEAMSISSLSVSEAVSGS